MKTRLNPFLVLTAIALVQPATAADLIFGASAGDTGNYTITETSSASYDSLLVQTASATANVLDIGAGVTTTINGNATLNPGIAGTTATKLTVTGATGTLAIANPDNGIVSLGSNTASAINTSILDLSGLGTFTANLGTTGTGSFNIGLGISTGNPATPHSLVLANASSIITPTLLVGTVSGGNAGTVTLKLGSGSNTIHADTFSIGGGGRSSGAVNFNSTTGSLVVKSADGTGRADLNLANVPTGATGSAHTGTLNLSGSTDAGTNLQLDALNMAARAGGQSATATLTFASGTLDVNTLKMARIPNSATMPNTAGNATATLNLDGGTVTFNTAVSLGQNDVTPSGTGTFTPTSTATLNIAGATAVSNATSFILGNRSGATGGNVVAGLNLTGGSLTMNSAITRVDAAPGTGGTITSTLTLDGGSLDMNNHAIGDATNPIAAQFKTGTLSNFASLNGIDNLSKDTTGTLTLAGASTYTGITTIGVGTLEVSSIGNFNSAPSNLGTASAAGLTNTAAAATTSTNSLQFVGNNGKTLRYIGGGETSDRAIYFNHQIADSATINASGSGALVLTGPISYYNTNSTAGNGPLILAGSNTDDNSLTGTFTEKTNHALNIQKIGAGTWLLTGNKNYNGITFVNDGILKFDSLANKDSDSALGTAKFLRTASTAVGYAISLGTASTTGTLQYTGASNSSTDRVVSLDGAGTLDAGVASGVGTLTFTGAISSRATTGTQTLTLAGDNAGANTISGNITDGSTGGKIALAKSGAGTWILSGANAYMGDTTITDGTLSVSTPAFADASILTIGVGAGSPAFLHLPNAGTDTVAALVIDGVSQANGLYDSTNSGGAITGEGKIKVGASTSDYAAWAASQVPPVTDGPNGDSDNDGVKNLIEYALADGMERGTLTGTTLSFTKRGAPWGSDLTYDIETTEDLGRSDPWTPVTPDVNNSTNISYTLQHPGDNFARLKVTVP